MLSRFLPSRWADPVNKKIFEGTFQSFFIQGISVILVFAGNLLLTRWAGADAYGKYVHVFNWISILAVVTTGGREDLVLTEIPRYHYQGQPGLIGRLIKRTNVHILIAALLSGIVFLTAVTLLPLPTLHEYGADFLAGWAAVYFLAFLTLNQLVLQSLDYIRLSQAVERLIRPLLLIIIWAAAIGLGVSPTSRLLIILAEVNLGVCCVILCWILVRKTKQFFKPREHLLPREGLTGKTLYFFLITLMTLLITKVTMLILPYFAPSREIGIYNISARFSDLVVYPFFLMHTVLPQLFARHTASTPGYKQYLYSSSTRLMTVLCLPLLLINILAGRYLLGLFGRDFVAGYPALIILSLSQFLYSFFGPANTILMMQGKEKQSVISLLIYVLLLIFANLLLLPVWGITGGALGMLVCCLVYNIILAIYAYRLHGVISPFFAFLIRSAG